MIRTFFCAMLLWGFLIPLQLNGQRVQAMVSGIQVDSILKAKPSASKMAFDPISKHLFYASSDGKIYEVFEDSGTDSLRFTSNQHFLTRLQGLCFLDSTMYLAGNIWYNSTGVGMIVKGKLQADGTRIWSNILSTEAYPTSSSSGDHGFTALNVDPSHQYLFFSGGSRTSFGEVESHNGLYPGMREQALTSKIYRIPIDAENLFWPNDSSFLSTSGFVFAEGTRNAYDMAWNAQQHLFAVDNAGDRDDPEELNWLQQGQHYGFPWRIGGNWNPLLNPNYDASQDPLINHQNGAFIAGHFNADPAFPPIPNGLQFTEPLIHYGQAADYYKDELTGEIKRASETGTTLRTFTAHRSPLGLIIDKDSLLNGYFKGKAFVMSFMPGGDSSGYTPLSPWGSPCPFVDSSRELVLMDITYDSTLADYTVHSSNIVTGFYLPVDVEQVGNTLYVIENYGSLWKIQLPELPEPPICYADGLFVYPNPFSTSAQVYFPNPNNENRCIKLYSSNGTIVFKSETYTESEYLLKKANLSNGSYQIVIESNGNILARQTLVIY
ncbi:MAG: T9SS type A sorting domain-containing protein [Flavobacteriales bacterium]